MLPATHSSEEEDAFMATLLDGLNDSFFTAVPSPDPSPVKPPPATSRCRLTPVKQKSSAGPTAAEVDMAALVDGAENWDWDDIEADFLTPKKNRKSKVPDAVDPAGYTREPCTRSIIERIVEVDNGGRYEKNLTVKLDPGEERRTVILRDDWTYTDIRTGDTINIIGSFTPLPRSSHPHPQSSAPPPTSAITLSSSSNLLILHPDTLLTATALSTAPTCTRKPLLQMLIHSSSDITPSLVWGNVLHEVMQGCLREGEWGGGWIDERIERVVRGAGGEGRGMGDLVRLGVGVEEAVREVKARAGGLKTFGERYMVQSPKATAILTDTRSTHRDPSLLAITHLHDVEEDIWSPTYGLKGKLDATVQAYITSPSPPTPFTLSSSAPSTIKTNHPAPLEIKTGRAIAGNEHRAQTLLYTLLASERYATAVSSGLLYYTQSQEVVRVPVGWNEIRGLIGVRNLLAGFVVRRGGGGRASVCRGKGVEEPFLPPTIDDERACKRCYALDTCMLYRKAVENVQDDTSPIADIYALKTGHLTPAQSAFFKEWESLISLEEQDLVRFKKELWTMGAREREARGRCFAGMVLQPGYRASEGRTAPAAKGIHQFTYQFTRAPSEGTGTETSLLNGHMSCGDAISVSVEPDLVALARGFIVELTPYEVVVGVDHELCVEAISRRLDALWRASGRGGCVGLKGVVFRIDKDEMFGGMGRIRDNLAQLFYAEGDSRRLSLVVDLTPPVFTAEPPSLPPSTSRLNPSQLSALSKVFSAEDYALILGMPGTGKTTVIAALIRVLVGMGKTVLLTSYTHSAVDTILAKMVDDEFGILRLGNIDKVHPDVRQFTLSSRRTPATVEQLEQQLMTPPVVATTCLSIDQALFSRRKFDYCIVDEASQITLPTCLGPLRFADKFVLVGDHFQLPPLVRNPAARKAGLEVSLFRRLSTAHPHAVIDLTHQYRMNEDIMLLSNRLIYGDRLKCGTGEVARRTLVLPDGGKYLRMLHAGKPACGKDCWMDRLLSESCKAVFVDTDLLPAKDTRVGDLVQNPTEATLVHQVTEALLQSGVRESQIGVISLYRQQIKLLSHLLQDRKEIEILTADRSQGRDKECIIISMVRSNDAGQLGDLVKDWRRMNVSFTRARSKLIIIGSRKTLQSAPLLSEFFTLMDGKRWILSLPPNADKMHSHTVEPKRRHTPGKRPAMEEEKRTTGKENDAITSPIKKIKKARADIGVLRGRPLLQDIMIGGN